MLQYVAVCYSVLHNSLSPHMTSKGACLRSSYVCDCRFQGHNWYVLVFTLFSCTWSCPFGGQNYHVCLEDILALIICMRLCHFQGHTWYVLQSCFFYVGDHVGDHVPLEDRINMFISIPLSLHASMPLSRTSLVCPFFTPFFVYVIMSLSRTELPCLFRGYTRANYMYATMSSYIVGHTWYVL